MMKAELWIIAGPNGAGKTTLVQRSPVNELLPAVVTLNPDERALVLLRQQGYVNFAGAPAGELRRCFIQAANEVFSELKERLHRNETVCIETVLSTDKYLPVVERMRNAGGFVGMIYVALRTPQLACERVAARARRGGHDVPVERIADRWLRSLEYLAKFSQLVHWLSVYDNSDSHPEIPPRLLAEAIDGDIAIYHPNDIPELTRALAPLNPKLP